MPATFVSTIVISSASTTWESATGFGARFHSVIGRQMLAERPSRPSFRRDDLEATPPRRLLHLDARRETDRELLDVRDHANHAPVATELLDRVDHDLERLRVERA